MWSLIDRIARRLEGEEHLVAFLGRHGVLNLVDDQHHVCFRLVDDLHEGLRQGRPA